MIRTRRGNHETGSRCVKLLFIGDIVGQPGRRAVKELVPKLRQQHGLDIVIANGENSASGNGITCMIARELLSYGVDVITSGDHLWDQKDIVELLEFNLKKEGYTTASASDGRKALEIAADFDPDIVLLSLAPDENAFKDLSFADDPSV